MEVLPFAVEAGFGIQGCVFFSGVKSAVAEAVFALEEGLGAQSAQQVPCDDAVLMVAEDFLDSVGRVCQTGGSFAVDRGCGFGCVPEAFAVFACLMQCRVVAGAGRVVLRFADGVSQPFDVAPDQFGNDFVCGPGGQECQGRLSPRRRNAWMRSRASAASPPPLFWPKSGRHVPVPDCGAPVFLG